jgi:hypothetical protein
MRVIGHMLLGLAGLGVLCEVLLWLMDSRWVSGLPFFMVSVPAGFLAWGFLYAAARREARSPPGKASERKR